MTRRVKVTIDQLGNTRVEAEGFLGNSCSAATKPIEDALAGIGGVSTTAKDEMYASEETHERQSW